MTNKAFRISKQFVMNNFKITFNTIDKIDHVRYNVHREEREFHDQYEYN